MNGVLRKQLTVDANHAIHLTLPPEMGDEVEVIVFPKKSLDAAWDVESLTMARLMDETGFVQSVLNSTEEDCWNDL